MGGCNHSHISLKGYIYLVVNYVYFSKDDTLDEMLDALNINSEVFSNL